MSAQEVLKKLQEIQANNIGIIDCHIETRKDVECTQIVFNMCNYGFDDKRQIDKKNKSKLFVHRFKWTDPNYTEELKVITEEIKMLEKNYG
jgi:hypothetical protein